MVLKSQVCTSRFLGVFFADSPQAAHFPLELVELTSSPSLTSPRPGRSLLTLNMNMRRISRQPVPQPQLMTEEVEPASIPFTPLSPFTPVSVSIIYSSTPVIRPQLAWSEEQALRESLETVFIGLDLRAQSLVEDPHLPQGLLTWRSRSPSVGRLEVEEHARGRRWRNEGRREETGRGRPRRSSIASARGRGAATKSLSVAHGSRRRE